MAISETARYRILIRPKSEEIINAICPGNPLLFSLEEIGDISIIPQSYTSNGRPPYVAGIVYQGAYAGLNFLADFEQGIAMIGKSNLGMSYFLASLTPEGLEYLSGGLL